MNLNIDTPYLVEERNTILLPTSGDYDHLLPDEARLIEVKGYTFYAVPNTPMFNSLLYAAGVPVPSPIYFSNYDWSHVKIYTAQAQMAGLLTSRRRCFNLSALGAGKTIGSLLAVDWLRQKDLISHALVVAPLSVLWTVWEKEIIEHFPRLIPVVLHGPRKTRAKLVQDDFWNVAIINFEGIGVIQQELLDRNFGMVIIDEAASYRDHRTRRWAMMHTLLQRTPYAAALTGSPTPNAPSDAYGLAKLMVPHRVPRSFRAFKMSVEVEVATHKWLPRKVAASIVAKTLQPAVRFLRSDISELKAAHFHDHRVLLSAKQEFAMAEMKREAIINFPEGVVDAINAATLMNKLLQIFSGAVYTSDRSVVDMEAVQRLETTSTLIDAAEGKVIVLAPYLHTATLVTEGLQKMGHNVVKVIGKVSPKDRTNIFRSFQDKRDKLRVLVAHPRIIARGLNLTAANTIIWFAPIFSRETYEQTNGRITRLGQNLEQYVIHLTSGAEEDAAYRVLERKGTMQDAVLAAFDLRMTGGDLIHEPSSDTELDQDCDNLSHGQQPSVELDLTFTP